MAVAAVLAGVAFLRSQPSPQLLTLASTGKGPISLAMSGKPGAITLQPTIPAEAAPAGRDYELWSLPQGAKTPRPMGLLPPGGVHLAADIRPGTQIMVSLEPKGGSPTGLPTGPVIYAGVVERVRE
jgi:anti-sigma-K factor RskA